MDDSRNHMQVRCENCGFPFDFAVSGRSPLAVCPACGIELTVTHCHTSGCSEEDPEKDGPFRQELFRIGVTGNDLLKCRAKNCPRLRRNEIGHGPSTEGNRFESGIGCGNVRTTIPLSELRTTEPDTARDQEAPRPRRILALTVAIQIFILLVAGVLMVKAFRGRPDMAESPKVRTTEKKVVHEVKTKAPMPEKDRSVAPPFVASKPGSLTPPTPAEKPSPSAPKPVAAPEKKPKAPPMPATAAPVVAAKPAVPLHVPKVPDTVKAPPTPAKSVIPKEPTVTPPPPKTTFTPPTVTPPPIPTAPVATPTPTEKNTPEKDLVAAKTQPTGTLPPQPKPKPSSKPKTQSKPESPPELSSKSGATQPEIPRKTTDSRLGIAEKMLEDAMASLAQNPEKSLEDTLHAVKLYGELHHPVPPTTYWLLGQTYAALSWGKMFLVNSPTVEEMTISPDSHWLMTRRRDETVWIWDVFRDQEHRSGFQLNTGTSRFASIRFTPDMRLIVGGQEDGTIRLWDLSRQDPGEASLRLRETVPGLAGLEVSPDGRWLIAYGDPEFGDRISRSNRYLRPLPIAQQVEESFLTMNRFMEEISEFPTLVVANGPPRIGTNPLFVDMKVPSRKSGKASPIANATYCPETMQQVTYLAATASPAVPAATPGVPSSTGPAPGTSPAGPSVVWLWDLQRLRNGTLPAAIGLHGHEGRIHTLGFSGDSRLLALGGADSVTRVYDLRSKTPQTPIAELRGHRLDVTAMAFAPGGRWIATGSRDNTIRLWSLDGPAESIVLNGHLGWISSLVVDSQGKKMYSGSYDKTVRIWNVHPDRIGAAMESPSLILQNDQGVVQELGLTVDETRLISRGGDGSLRIRDLDGEISNRHSVMFRNRMLPINHFVVTPDNRWLIFSYVNQRNPAGSGIRLWPLGLDQLVEIVGE